MSVLDINSFEQAELHSENRQTSQGEEFPQNRLKALIHARRDTTSETMISELYSEVLRFAGPSSQFGDLTAVIVKRTGAAVAKAG